MPSPNGRFAMLRRRRWTVLLGAAFVALAIVMPVAAAEILSENEPRVRAGETVTDDLYVFGGNAEIAGTVTRDLIVMSGELDIESTGRVQGNLNALSGDISVRGAIDRTVRVAGGDVDLYGPIGSDLVVLGGNVDLHSGASVRGDVIVYGGDVALHGDIGGEVRGAVNHLIIDSSVAGRVRVTVSDLDLGANARIAGPLEYQSDDTADLNSAAIVSGGIEQKEPNAFFPGDSGISWITGALFRLLCLLIAGVVLVLAAPRASIAIANGVRHRLPISLVAGIVLLVVVPIVLVLLMVTLVGIPIALIGWAAFFAALYLSQVFVGLAIGRFILPNRWGDFGRGFNLLAMTLGVIMIGALRLIPVPFVDISIAIVIGLVGLGAVVIGPSLRRQNSGSALPS